MNDFLNGFIVCFLCFREWRENDLKWWRLTSLNPVCFSPWFVWKGLEGTFSLSDLDTHQGKLDRHLFYYRKFWRERL